MKKNLLIIGMIASTISMSSTAIKVGAGISWEEAKEVATSENRAETAKSLNPIFQLEIEKTKESSKKFGGSLSYGLGFETKSEAYKKAIKGDKDAFKNASIDLGVQPYVAPGAVLNFGSISMRLAGKVGFATRMTLTTTEKGELNKNIDEIKKSVAFAFQPGGVLGFDFGPLTLDIEGSADHVFEKKEEKTVWEIKKDKFKPVVEARLGFRF